MLVRVHTPVHAISAAAAATAFALRFAALQLAKNSIRICENYISDECLKAESAGGASAVTLRHKLCMQPP
jgi:hypothetical protein